MANEMSHITIPGAKFDNAYEMQESRSSPGPGDWFHIPAGITKIAVTLEVTGKGRVEATTDTRANVNSGAVTALRAWPDGDIVSSKSPAQAVLIAGSAFRMVNISGTTRITARAE